MLSNTFFSKTLNATSALTLSAVLLGTTFTTASQAMEDTALIESASFKRMRHVSELKAYADLKSASTIPAIKENDLLLINVGHGMVRSCTQLSDSNTEAYLLENHKKFIELIKTLNEADYTTLTTKAKLASGNEFIKVGEKGLPTLLDELSASRINIIPISSRGDDGKCATSETLEILSRTEKEFVALNYNYKIWNKPAPLQNPNIEISFQDNIPEVHGTYKLRNGVIYSTSGKHPHKSAAIIGLMDHLKEKNQLPLALYFIDVSKTIDQTSEDLKDVDFGIPIYLLKYTQPKAFSTPEDLKEFYIHRLGKNFQEYESQLNEVFSVK